MGLFDGIIITLKEGGIDKSEILNILPSVNTSKGFGGNNGTRGFRVTLSNMCILLLFCFSVLLPSRSIGNSAIDFSTIQRIGYLPPVPSSIEEAHPGVHQIFTLSLRFASSFIFFFSSSLALFHNGFLVKLFLFVRRSGIFSKLLLWAHGKYKTVSPTWGTYADDEFADLGVSDRSQSLRNFCAKSASTGPPTSLGLIILAFKLLDDLGRSDSVIGFGRFWEAFSFVPCSLDEHSLRLQFEISPFPSPSKDKVFLDLILFLFSPILWSEFASRFLFNSVSLTTSFNFISFSSFFGRWDKRPSKR